MSQNEPSASTQIDRILDRKVGDAVREGKPVGRATIEVVASSGRATIVVEDADRLGVLASSVGVERSGGDPARVPAQAERAAERLNYLQEPLAVIETEDRRGRGILRSATPRKVEGGREYNEAILEGGGGITIRRYRAEPGARRRQVPSNISRETLGRLVDDLGEILESE